MMKQYWIRILAAWFLVRTASQLLKDAEQLLRKAGDTTAEIEAELTVEEVTPAPTNDVIEVTATDG